MDWDFKECLLTVIPKIDFDRYKQVYGNCRKTPTESPTGYLIHFMFNAQFRHYVVSEID